MIRVVGFWADEEMELSVAHGLELVPVLLEFVFINLHCKALEGSQKLAVKVRGCWAKLFIDQLFDFISPGNDHRDLLILDELKLFGGGPVVEEQWKIFIAGVFEIGEDILAVPARLLLMKVFVEVGLDGGC